jgi:hypothetical protein
LRDVSGEYEPGGTTTTGGEGESTIPVWQGRDVVVSQEVRIVGPNGEKVDVMTFRGSFERDLNEFAERDPEFRQASRPRTTTRLRPLCRNVSTTSRRCSTQRTS